MYGTAHLAWLAAIAATAAFLIRLYLRADREKRIRIQLILSFVILGIEIAQDIYLERTGHLTVDQLPLHLCGMAVFITLIQSASSFGYSRNGSRALGAVSFYLGQVRYGLCLPGALLALLFPDWTAYPPYAFMCIVGFVNHGLISSSALLLALPEDFPIEMKGLWVPATFLLAVIPCMYAFDVHFRTNYYFLLAGPAGSPLAWLQRTFPDHYLLSYAVLAAVLISLWYAIGTIAKKGQQKRMAA